VLEGPLMSSQVGEDDDDAVIGVTGKTLNKHY
jgi:hypothetical protein